MRVYRLFYRFHGGFQITYIIQGIEYAENINPVFSRRGNKSFDHVICVVPVTEQVLATQQHLQAGVGQGCT